MIQFVLAWVAARISFPLTAAAFTCTSGGGDGGRQAESIARQIMDLDLFGAFDGTEKVNEESVPDLPPGQDEKSKGKRATLAEEDKEESGKAKKRTKESDEKSRKGGDQESKEASQADLVMGQEVVMERGDGSRVTSFSVRPAGWKPKEPLKTTSKPAKEYPFTLDPFQKSAIQFIEDGESVLVSAHTSAGKTVVAEYAIAKSLRDGQRVIYTSPIKALSNQKYRDLQAEFSDVGLMTGDITINPTATCLIMTTEILRSMLYRGSEIMREVAWVVYDEIHYMRDKSRGVVWEESIILLPHNVRFVFLSATIPNAREFASWVVQLHRQPCHVVYTDFRPVPLEHYVFPSGGEGLNMVVDKRGAFKEESFNKAMAAIKSASDEPKDKGGKRQKSGGRDSTGGGKGGQTSDVKRIVRLIMKRGLDPAIVFSFSKKECEAFAQQMSKMSLNSEEHSKLVEQVFNNAMDSLADEDRSLPQVDAMLPYLKKGIGFHHGGLLPILKEVVEILFAEGLVKILFATETFSIGLNMPAHTVVFTNTRKYDGKDFRWISSGEYIQMSGRAGRRGKDDKGMVIQMLDETMEPAVAKGILYGEADPLFSSYHISYNMLLNMLRVEGADPEFVVRSSFHQFQQEQEAPALELQASELEAEMAAIQVEGEEEIEEWHTMTEQLKKLEHDVRQTVMAPEKCLPYIQTGRLIQARQDEKGYDWGWGTVVNMHHTKDRSGVPSYTVECLALTIESGDEGADAATGLRPPKECEEALAKMRVVPLPLNSICKLSAVRVHMPKDLRPETNRAAVSRSLKEILKRFGDSSLPLLDPVADMGIRDKTFCKVLQRVGELKERIDALPVHSAADKDHRISQYLKKVDLAERAKLIRAEAKKSQHVAMKDDLRRMLRVLRRLGHCDADGVIQLKGRAACEVNTCDELLVTELMFSGVFSLLSEEQIAALLSCLVFQEKGKEGGPKLPENLMEPYRQLQEAARQVARVCIESKVTLDLDEYVNSFTPDMMEVCFAWCSGCKFVDVMKLTDAFEGTVIRVIRRLEELLRQLGIAASSIGNVELRAKMEGAANKIRRGIAFSASLYL
jgi:ATP-dependent RNA helicase DOB1